jgi:hypothetical protein
MLQYWGNSYRFAAPAGGYDADAQDYINRVIAADVAAGNSSGLEPAVQNAINAFVVGCKADGIWTAIKASCILAGAQTLAGALVPLLPTMPTPTNNNFVGATDYNRKTGLVGNGSSKYLNSNRANNADPQNSQHLGVYVSTRSGANNSLQGYMGDLTSGQTGASYLYDEVTTLRNLVETTGSLPINSSFHGISRAASGSYSRRTNGTTTTITTASATPTTGNIHIFRLNRTSGNFLYGAHRLAFYSIGESLNLSQLDTRVSALVTAISTAF